MQLDYHRLNKHTDDKCYKPAPIDIVLQHIDCFIEGYNEHAIDFANW